MTYAKQANDVDFCALIEHELYLIANKKVQEMANTANQRPTVIKLYKEGKFDFDKFFDPEGQRYTLEHLRRLDGLKFKKLGV